MSKPSNASQRQHRCPNANGGKLSLDSSTIERSRRYLGRRSGSPAAKCTQYEPESGGQEGGVDGWLAEMKCPKLQNCVLCRLHASC